MEPSTHAEPQVRKAPESATERRSADAQSRLERPAPGMAQRAGAFATRVILGIAGIGLLVGFFLPWIHLSNGMSLSGFGLVVTSGQPVQDLSGPARLLLFGVPACALLLFAAAVRGSRFTAWVGFGSGLLILGYGLFTLIRVFFDATGLGMWLVVCSALLSLGVGLVALGRSTQRR